MFFLLKLFSFLKKKQYKETQVGNPKGTDFTNIVYLPLFPLFYFPPSIGFLDTWNKQTKTFLSKDTKGQNFPPPGNDKERQETRRQGRLLCTASAIVRLPP